MMIKCARTDCSVEFVAATHNQKYHDAECCRIATNRRIMEKYYARRDQLQGKVRYCEDGCGTKLSRYNDMTICSGCHVKQSSSDNKKIVDKIMSIDWLPAAV